MNASFVCGSDNSLVPGFPNASVRFRATVSGDTNLTVVFSFDYLNAGGVPNPNSPNRTVNVPFPGFGANATVETNWTYTALNQNFTSGNTSSTYWVHVGVRDETGQVGNWSQPFFPVIVNQNSAPFMDGLLSLNSVPEAIRFPNPVIPLLYENVSMGDPDADPATVTWAWGDGTWTVNKTPPLTSRMNMRVTHQYPPSRFPLNESPRNVDIRVQAWIDDGLGHNVSYNSTAEFYIDFDYPPSVRIDKPTIGSIWKVGETVSMVGNVTDREGDPTTAYWDFDNRTDSTGIGDPTRNRDTNGTTAAHAYSAPGVYNITLWATDGNKEFCGPEPGCTNFTTHWTKALTQIQVRFNLPPIVALTNSTAQLGQPTLLRASVFDPDGDNMTVTWVFGDGTPDVTNVTGSSPRASPQVFQVFQGHTYATTGNHTLTLSVFDGNDTVHDSKLVFVQSFNEPPVLLGLHVTRANGTSAGNNTFLLNDTMVVTAQMYDAENNTLNVSIDWGDGTIANLTIDPKTAPSCSLDNQSRNICSVSFLHAYLNIGSNLFQEYTVLVTVSDNQVFVQQNSTGGPPIIRDHTKNQSVIVIITNYQFQGLGPWDWWDYSTLAGVLGIPTLLIARFAWKVRLERREE